MQFSVDGPQNHNKEPIDAFTGMSIKRSLWKFLNMTTIPRRKNVTTLWPDADQAEVDFFAYVFCYTVVLPSFLVCNVSVCLSLTHLLLSACIL